MSKLKRRQRHNVQITGGTYPEGRAPKGEAFGYNYVGSAPLAVAVALFGHTVYKQGHRPYLASVGVAINLQVKPHSGFGCNVVGLVLQQNYMRRMAIGKKGINRTKKFLNTFAVVVGAVVTAGQQNSTR